MSETRIDQMVKVHSEALELFSKKNADYGDAFATYGTVGVIVRMGDKIQRLISVSNKGVALVDTESLRDTLIDLHNYAAMGVMLLDEQREKLEKISVEAEPKCVNASLIIENLS
jgi:hypothetical protein